MPTTIKGKEQTIIEALPVFIKWVKDHYVLHSYGIDCKTKELFVCYYRQSKDRISKQKLAKYIKQPGIRTVEQQAEDECVGLRPDRQMPLIELCSPLVCLFHNLLSYQEHISSTLFVVSMCSGTVNIPAI